MPLCLLLALFAFGCTREGAGPGVATATVPPAPSGATSSAGPKASAPLLAVRTEPHPAVATVTAFFVHQGTVNEAGCEALTGASVEEFDRCGMTLLANGTAVSVDVTYACGAHTCSVVSFVWYGDEAAPFRLEDDGPLEVSPDHRELLVTELIYPEMPVTPIAGRTLRIDRATNTRTPFFDCISAVLSPSARYYACRDLQGNVLRVPVTGGRPEVVIVAELPPGERVKLGGPFGDYPAPVKFANPKELVYSVFLDESGTVVESRAPWLE
jgi:hypothetical protein